LGRESDVRKALDAARAAPEIGAARVFTSRARRSPLNNRAAADILMNLTREAAPRTQAFDVEALRRAAIEQALEEDRLLARRLSAFDEGNAQIVLGSAFNRGDASPAALIEQLARGRGVLTQDNRQALTALIFEAALLINNVDGDAAMTQAGYRLLALTVQNMSTLTAPTGTTVDWAAARRILSLAPQTRGGLTNEQIHSLIPSADVSAAQTRVFNVTAAEIADAAADRPRFNMNNLLAQARANTQAPLVVLTMDVGLSTESDIRPAIEGFLARHGVADAAARLVVVAQPDMAPYLSNLRLHDQGVTNLLGRLGLSASYVLFSETDAGIADDIMNLVTLKKVLEGIADQLRLIQLVDVNA
jgi:hypothetical protein